ncbi:endocuticle structural glycoprotein SgAbd-9 [Drosophila ficusphila]|uniref:endocuticle structural glycoprotein SgAbd-9 n=1 Tax=Drosophila ficusphila TaxID=30025 RepID=UPI0007E6DC8A|nr:endocuticle structural glycoprotein SgAbd-9 [Drosophila ficusphila]
MFALLLILTGCQLWSWPAESAAINGPVPILKSSVEQLNSGSYLLSYETADGTYREELAIVKPNAKRTDDDDLEVSGIYGYINESGQKLVVTYTADKNGFLPHVKYVASPMGETINKSP